MEMVQVYLDCDESYPTFTLVGGPDGGGPAATETAPVNVSTSNAHPETDKAQAYGGVRVCVDIEKALRWERITKEYEEMQAEMAIAWARGRC